MTGLKYNLGFLAAVAGAAVLDCAHGLGRVIGAAVAGFESSVNVRGEKK